ncbi:fimbrial biogenesis chaperone [Paraburkholderia graminis]|uniref:fimbrial biogenesis chaperone n=1 Tax=Paraburkholderia graminis TaxID=60548 RepID=UPI0038B737E8
MVQLAGSPTQARSGRGWSELCAARVPFAPEILLPAGLQGKADDAPAKLVWRLGTHDGKPALLVSNPTPFHVTIIEALVGEGPNPAKFDEGGMVDPGGELALPLSATPAAGKVSFTTLNDYGGPMKHEATLQ